MAGTTKLSCSPRFERLSCRANITSLLMTLRSATYAYVMKRLRLVNVKCDVIGCSTRNETSVMILQCYHYLIDKPHVMKDAGDT